MQKRRELVWMKGTDIVLVAGVVVCGGLRRTWKIKSRVGVCMRGGSISLYHTTISPILAVLLIHSAQIRLADCEGGRGQWAVLLAPSHLSLLAASPLHLLPPFISSNINAYNDSSLSQVDSSTWLSFVKPSTFL